MVAKEVLKHDTDGRLKKRLGIIDDFTTEEKIGIKAETSGLVDLLADAAHPLDKRSAVSSAVSSSSASSTASSSSSSRSTGKEEQV